MKNLHVAGAKDDSGKNRVALVLGGFSRGLLAMSKVGTFGANKYTANGWISVKDGINRYEDAMLRHWLAYKGGEKNDPESGLPHLAHCAWNVLAVLTLTIMGEENASKDCGGQCKQVDGEANHDIRAGVPPIHPCRSDDAPNVFKERTEQQSRSNQKVHGSSSGIADHVGKEQGWYEQQRVIAPFTGGHVSFPLEGQRIRGSSIDFPADKARTAQAVGQSSSGVATEHQGDPDFY